MLPKMSCDHEYFVSKTITKQQNEKPLVRVFFQNGRRPFDIRRKKTIRSIKTKTFALLGTIERLFEYFFRSCLINVRLLRIHSVVIDRLSANVSLFLLVFRFYLTNDDKYFIGISFRVEAVPIVF